MNKELVTIVIKSIVLFLIILLLLCVVSYFYNIHIIKKTFTYRKENDFQEYASNLKDKQIDYLFLGSSHTLGGINPDYMPSSYNFGNAGNSSIEEYYIFKKVLANDKLKIKNVVIEIDPHMFWERFDDGAYLFREFWYFSQFSDIRELTKINNDSYIKLMIKKYFPVIGDSDKFGLFLKEPVLSELHLGWKKNTTIYKIKEFDTELKEIKTIRQKAKTAKGISERRLDYFLKMIKLAKDNNVKVNLLKYPHHQFFSRAIGESSLDLKAHYNELFEEVDNILEAENYKILDYFNLYSDHKEYFVDLEHLNSNGAEYLSKQVFEDIQ